MTAVIIEKTMNDEWLSNTWLVADEPGGHAVLIDTGGPSEPIRKWVREQDLTVTHVLCTHHHIDHVLHNGEYKSTFDCPVCGHASEAALFPDALDMTLEHGQELVSGGLHVRALHIPGHTLGQLGFLVNDDHVFTGDTLFKNSVGGTRGPGHTTFEDIRHSILEVLMTLPPGTEVHPGHMDVTTIGAEWEQNPFVRMWRGRDPQGTEACTAFGQPATLLLRAADYDGGTKCWVRFEEDGVLDLVPGSQVKPLQD